MKILFICKSNQFRSQMAASLYNKMTGGNEASSAGTHVGSDDEPEGIVIETRYLTPDFFELMEEKGMYIRDNRTRKLLPEMVEEADIVVSMAEEPFVPDFLSDNKKVLHWNVNNPVFATREISESTYLQIEKLVKELIDENEK
jgi:protein-tyrosine-phosphatase